MTDAPALLALLDKQAITEVIHRYCRAIDRRDEAALRGCFHDESTHDQGGFRGPSREFCGYALAKLALIGATQHLVSNLLIDVDQSNTTARSEACFIAYHRLPASGVPDGLFASDGHVCDLFVGGRYLDQLRRHGTGWQIVQRTGIYDWVRRERADERAPGTSR